MVWLESLTTDLLENQEESKIPQADMLTAIGDVEDEKEATSNAVEKARKE